MLAFGVRRTTLTEVARRAGVSRPTVYRHWPDVTSLTTDLLTREVLDLLPHGPDDARGTYRHERERGVDEIVTTVAAVRQHPLFAKLVETDPELLLTYVFDRLGSSQREILTAFEAALRRGQQDGSIRTGDTGELAATLLLVVQSAVQSARIVAEPLPPERLDQQLRLLLDRYLRPENEEQS